MCQIVGSNLWKKVLHFQKCESLNHINKKHMLKKLKNELKAHDMSNHQALLSTRRRNLTWRAALTLFRYRSQKSTPTGRHLFALPITSSVVPSSSSRSWQATRPCFFIYQLHLHTSESSCQLIVLFLTICFTILSVRDPRKLFCWFDFVTDGLLSAFLLENPQLLEIFRKNRWSKPLSGNINLYWWQGSGTNNLIKISFN